MGGPRGAGRPACPRVVSVCWAGPLCACPSLAQAGRGAWTVPGAPGGGAGWDRTGCRGGGGGGRAQLSPSLVPQEAREGCPVPHRARLRARHASGGGPLPAAAQGPEPADDRRVPGQPAEAVQPRRARVSGLPLPTSAPTHGAPGTSSGAGVPPPLPQTHADPRHLQPRPAGPAPPLVPWPPY